MSPTLLPTYTQCDGYPVSTNINHYNFHYLCKHLWALPSCFQWFVFWYCEVGYTSVPATVSSFLCWPLPFFIDLWETLLCKSSVQSGSKHSLGCCARRMPLSALPTTFDSDSRLLFGELVAANISFMQFMSILCFALLANLFWWIGHSFQLWFLYIWFSLDNMGMQFFNRPPYLTLVPSDFTRHDSLTMLTHLSLSFFFFFFFPGIEGI